SFISCLGIVVGSIIGSGIFMVPSIMIKALPSPMLLFIVWIVSAVVSIIGGLVVIGMGTAFPHARDLLDYYNMLFPKWVGYLFNIGSNWIINPFGTVVVGFVFAEYLGYFIPLDPLGIKIATISLLLILTIINTFNVEIADRFQIVFTGTKVVSIIVLVLFLLIPAKGNIQHFSMNETVNWNVLKIIGAFFAASTGALNAFDGWYLVSHLTPEVKGGVKTVGRSIVVGLLICMLLYLLTSFAYQFVLTPSEIANSNMVAVTALEKVMGGWAPGLVTILILISTSSSVNAFLISSSRLMQSTAEQKMLPAFLKFKNKKQIPVTAFWIIFVFQTMLVITGTYEILLDFTLFVVWLFVTILTGGFLYVYIKENLTLPGFKRIPMIAACILLLVFGLLYLINFFITF
ncbi:MAG: amino acid permease, partial [Chitinophagia bacterium]|nr:amino acid permease [Chitinophagia bacterium]